MTLIYLRLLALAATAAVMSGCASPDGKVNLHYLPTQKSALSSVKPMTLALQVEDQRVAEEKELVGTRAKGKIRSPKDATLVVRDALKAELVQNGHHVSEGQRDTVDATVKVALKRFFSDYRLRFFDGEVIGNINADISIVRIGGKTTLDVLPLNATHREVFVTAAKDRIYEKALDRTLAEFVRSFALEPKVIEALQATP